VAIGRRQRSSHVQRAGWCDVSGSIPNPNGAVGDILATQFPCICTPWHCYGDIGEHPVDELCLHCHYDPFASRECPAYGEEDK
jgi:hypothetical protein